MEKKIEYTYKHSYRDICEALDYSDEFFMETKHLHSSSDFGPDLIVGDLEDAGSNSQRGSFPSASQVTSQANTGTSSLHQPTSRDETPSNFPFSASYLQEMSLRRKQPHQDDSPNHAAGRDPPTSQSLASQKKRRLVPDRSAKPLGDLDVARRRRKPYEIPSSADLPSTSVGKSAPGTESAKRPLPESPTSAFQPTSSSRRRHPVEERSSSDEMGLPSRPENKGSKDQRGHA